MRFIVILDLEGVLTPPGTDFAEYLARYLGDDYYRFFKYFDTYDDYRWIKEYMTKTGRYQTGTTPFYTLLMAYSHGLREEDIIEISKQYAEKVVYEDFKDIVRRLRKNYDIVVTTSSYFPYSHEVCRRLGIDLDNVYSTCDTKIDDVNSEHVLQILESIASRDKIRKVVESIARICLNIVSENLPLNSVDEYVNSIDDLGLRKYLYQRLVQQRGIAGSKFKASIVKKFRDLNNVVIYVGDSIVDSEAASLANISISINTTSPHLLYSSSINVVTENYRNIVDIIENIQDLVMGKLPSRLDVNDAIIYFSNDIVKNLNTILELNKKVREKVKLRYFSSSDSLFRLEVI